MKKYGIIVYAALFFAFYLSDIHSASSQPKSFYDREQSSVTAPIPFSYREHWLFIEPGDTVQGTWNHISSMQTPLFGTAVFYLENVNKVFICGGIDSLDNPKRDCYYYNIQTNSYEIRSQLPTGRAYGKLVKVKDSLYLVGSVSNFNIPDGALFKYNPVTDQWQVKAAINAPAVHEMGVCVWNDSLIITIGGSTGGFNGALNTVRVYNPSNNTWRLLSASFNLFPVNITASQAECIGNDIIVAGGYSSTPYNTVYRGNIYSGYIDSLYWPVEGYKTSPFGTGVYRIGGGKFGNFMVFGPALSAGSCINQIWGYDIYDSTWTRFLPNTIDIASRTNIAVKHTADSLNFYLFGGITRDTAGYHFIKTSEKYSTGNPVIGISGNNNKIPEKFILYQNYPNPFNPVSTIKYSLPKLSFTVIKVYDISGRLVSTLVNEFRPAGVHSINFDASKLSTGIYFYTLTAGGFSDTKKMAVVK